MKFDKHTFWMIIGCVLPLFLIFLAPAFGISGSIPIIIFIGAMFIIHLFMPMPGHGGHQHGQSHQYDDIDKQTSNKENHEHH